MNLVLKVVIVQIGLNGSLKNKTLPNCCGTARHRKRKRSRHGMKTCVLLLHSACIVRFLLCKSKAASSASFKETCACASQARSLRFGAKFELAANFLAQTPLESATEAS